MKKTTPKVKPQVIVDNPAREISMIGRTKYYKQLIAKRQSEAFTKK